MFQSHIFASSCRSQFEQIMSKMGKQRSRISLISQEINLGLLEMRYVVTIDIHCMYVITDVCVKQKPFYNPVYKLKLLPVSQLIQSVRKQIMDHNIFGDEDKITCFERQGCPFMDKQQLLTHIQKRVWCTRNGQVIISQQTILQTPIRRKQSY